MRELAYYEAKFEALDEIMSGDERVHLINGTFLSLSPHRHVFQNLQKRLENDFGFQADLDHFAIFGTCRACQRATPKSSKRHSH